VKTGKIKVFGEIMAVYKGFTLMHPSYQPYLEICEQYGIPIAYHTGGSSPTAQRSWPNYRIYHGDPLLIEDVLAKYPSLKINLMHAGGVFFEHTLRLMGGYRNLYADLGILLWTTPRSKDYALRFLKSAKKYGLLDRVLFGSDQMMWPDAITSSIDFLNSLDFLTEEEKQMILYQNGLKFLGIEE
jgi:predicted TIM-barrel fold metal-dependent hydrolase